VWAKVVPRNQINFFRNMRTSGVASLGSEIDANFYSLVHQLAVTSGQQAPEDRRRRHRHRFQSIQRIALPRGPGVPDEADFIEVQCHDLTREGFSFLLPSRPTFEWIVTAFGVPPEVIYVLAKVSRSVDVLVSASSSVQTIIRHHDRAAPRGASEPTGKPMVLVGCRFIERLRR
jgi:hypothetical protein